MGQVYKDVDVAKKALGPRDVVVGPFEDGYVIADRDSVPEEFKSLILDANTNTYIEQQRQRENPSTIRSVLFPYNDDTKLNTAKSLSTHLAPIVGGALSGAVSSATPYGAIAGAIPFVTAAARDGHNHLAETGGDESYVSPFFQSLVGAGAGAYFGHKSRQERAKIDSDADKALAQAKTDAEKAMAAELRQRQTERYQQYAMDVDAAKNQNSIIAEANKEIGGDYAAQLKDWRNAVDAARSDLKDRNSLKLKGELNAAYATLAPREETTFDEDKYQKLRDKAYAQYKLTTPYDEAAFKEKLTERLADIGFGNEKARGNWHITDDVKPQMGAELFQNPAGTRHNFVINPLLQFTPKSEDDMFTTKPLLTRADIPDDWLDADKKPQLDLGRVILLGQELNKKLPPEKQLDFTNQKHLARLQSYLSNMFNEYALTNHIMMYGGELPFHTMRDVYRGTNDDFEKWLYDVQTGPGGGKFNDLDNSLAFQTARNESSLRGKNLPSTYKNTQVADMDDRPAGTNIATGDRIIAQKQYDEAKQAVIDELQKDAIEQRLADIDNELREQATTRKMVEPSAADKAKAASEVYQNFQRLELPADLINNARPAKPDFAEKVPLPNKNDYKVPPLTDEEKAKIMSDHTQPIEDARARDKKLATHRVKNGVKGAGVGALTSLIGPFIDFIHPYVKAADRKLRDIEGGR